MSHAFATISLIVVAAICLALTVLAGMAYRRTASRSLLFVLGAFAVFAAKSAVTAWALATDSIEHETLEVVGGAMDLAIVGLLVAPFLRR